MAVVRATINSKRIQTAEEEVLKFAREEKMGEEESKRLHHSVVAAAMELNQTYNQSNSPTNEPASTANTTHQLVDTATGTAATAQNHNQQLQLWVLRLSCWIWFPGF